MNYSKQREIILDTLKNNVVHPSADYLYNKVHEIEPNISKGTLYRNLNLLAQEGVIKKIDGLENASHFDHNAHEHYHFICEKCKQIFDIDKSAIGVLTNENFPSDFQITWHDILFRGICPNCLNTSN